MIKNQWVQGVKLNLKTIAAMKEGDRIQDAEMPVLWATCGKGKKTFYFLKKWKYKQIRKTIGDASMMTRDQAVAQCVEYLRSLQQYGNIEGEGRAETPSIVTLREVVDFYGRETKEEYARILRNRVPEWLDRKVSDIRREEVLDAFQTISRSSPVSANRFISFLRAAINLARKKGMLSCENPAAGIEKNREKPRNRFLKHDEACALIDALKARAKIPVSRTSAEVLLMTLYTWQRNGNVMAMEWSEIDRDTWTWTIPEEKAKAGREIVVPLIPEAIEILRGREGLGSGKYVFERGKGKPITRVQKLWERICRELGLENVHIHDLRHTGATWALRSGADITTVSAALGHASVSFTARVYAHVMTESKLDAARGALAAMTAKIEN